MEKTFLVSKKNILSEVAKWAVVQSPYHRPDNLEKVLDELDNHFGAWDNENVIYRKMTYQDLKNFLDKELREISGFNLWNERKNGSKVEYKFVSRNSDEENNPDDDFIDLDALIRNIANSIIREGTEISIPKILGKEEVKVTKI